MRKPAVALLILFVLLMPGSAQEVEQVTVYGGNLSGFWQVAAPVWLQISLFGSVKWGPHRNGFCRLSRDADGYGSHCYGQDAGHGGTLAVDGTHFHLAWGSMLARLVYDGEVTSATGFEGHFAAKLMGIAITEPQASQGSKIEIRPDAPDGAGKAGLLRRLLAGESVAHDPALDDRIAQARNVQLGRIETIVFLGRQQRPGAEGPGHPPDPDYLAVYAVLYGDDERLCWLHQDDDGKLAAFQCG